MNIGIDNKYGNNLQYVAFNQNQTCFACATTTGFRIFNCEPLREKVRQDFDNGGLGFIEMLFCSNYLALVGGGERPLYPLNRVLIWEDLQKIISINLEFNYPVLSVRLRRDRIVVIMEKIIKVYTFTQNPTQLHVFETHTNPKGLCALCPNSDNALLAFPWSKAGNVQLLDLGNADRDFINIAAHSTEIACMSLNSQGTRLATASERGTLIRVFDTSNGQLQLELRRGANPATIYSINFNLTSTRLCVSSDRGTIHIFALEDTSLNQRSNFNPLPFSYFSSVWSFCRLHVPDYPICICAFSENDDYIHEIAPIILSVLPVLVCLIETVLNSIVPEALPKFIRLSKNMVWCQKIYAVVCSDGYFYKFSYTLQGESVREVSTSFLSLSENADNGAGNDVEPVFL